MAIFCGCNILQINSLSNVYNLESQFYGRGFLSLEVSA